MASVTLLDHPKCPECGSFLVRIDCPDTESRVACPDCRLGMPYESIDNPKAEFRHGYLSDQEAGAIRRVIPDTDRTCGRFAPH